MGSILFVILKSWHLLGWNSIFHCFSQICTMSGYKLGLIPIIWPTFMLNWVKNLKFWEWQSDTDRAERSLFLFIFHCFVSCWYWLIFICFSFAYYWALQGVKKLQQKYINVIWTAPKGYLAICFGHNDINLGCYGNVVVSCWQLLLVLWQFLLSCRQFILSYWHL